MSCAHPSGFSISAHTFLDWRSWASCATSVEVRTASRRASSPAPSRAACAPAAACALPRAVAPTHAADRLAEATTCVSVVHHAHASGSVVP